MAPQQSKDTTVTISRCFQSAYGPHQNHRRFYSIAVFKLNHAMVSGITSYLNKCLLGNKWLRL